MKKTRNLVGIIAIIAVIGIVALACDNETTGCTNHTAGAAATCTTAQTCTDCGHVMTAALGHDFTEWQVTTTAKVYAQGVETAKCSRCPELGTLTRPVAMLVLPAGLYLGTPTSLTATSTHIDEVAANNLNAAWDHVVADGNPDGEYTLLISENITTGGDRGINRANRQLTIIGIGGERTIRRTEQGSLFVVGATNVEENISLTIGNNITLVGRTDGEHGADSHNSTAVVNVRNGASFVMLDGSKITGNTSTATTDTTGQGAAVVVQSGASFTMKGGSITGNAATSTTTNSTGGVWLQQENSTFVMEGGSVSGNNAFADVYIASNSGFGLTLSGNAAIGDISLNGTDTTRGGINVAGGWTGSVDILNLRGNNATMATVIGWWFNATTPIQVVRGVTGYTLTAADIAKFPLGNFLSSATSNNTQLISTGEADGAPNGFMLNNTGHLVAKP